MPKVSTRQSHMEVFLGKMPAVDSNHYIDDMAFKVNVLAKTADYTVKASESGTFFTDYGAAGTVDFTLPAAADGLNYHFYSVAAGALKVIGAAADLMVAFNDVDANDVSFATEAEIIGAAFYVVCDGDQWYVFPYLEETVTVTVTT